MIAHHFDYFSSFYIIFVFPGSAELSFLSSSYSYFWSSNIVVPFLWNEIYLESFFSLPSVSAFFLNYFITSNCFVSTLKLLHYLLQTGHFHCLTFCTFIKLKKVLRSKHWPCMHLMPRTGISMRFQLKGSIKLTLICSI